MLVWFQNSSSGSSLDGHLQICSSQWAKASMPSITAIKATKPVVTPMIVMDFGTRIKMYSLLRQCSLLCSEWSHLLNCLRNDAYPVALYSSAVNQFVSISHTAAASQLLEKISISIHMDRHDNTSPITYISERQTFAGPPVLLNIIYALCYSVGRKLLFIWWVSLD